MLAVPSGPGMTKRGVDMPAKKAISYLSHVRRGGGGWAGIAGASSEIQGDPSSCRVLHGDALRIQ